MKISREFEEHSNKHKITLKEISRDEQNEISEEGKKVYSYSYL